MTEAAKILVIDDNEDDRGVYRRALERFTDAAYTVIEAGDGEEGLKEIERVSPACVLLDYSLPGRNGVDVLKQLRTKHPFTPVVMLTGQGNEKVAVRAMQEGAQNYIAKSSITSEELHRVIELASQHCAMEKRIHDQRQSLEIFTRALAHDLKEPVRTIRSFLSLMTQRETLSESGREYFNYIHESADRMAALIDAVHYYTRLDGAARETPKERCDVAAALQDIQQDLGELIRERDAALTCGDLPFIAANAAQLRQLLQNLISNAIRHAGAHPSVHVAASDEGDHWALHVSDNGAGVKAEFRERIFHPFTRFAHDEDQGLGMGLAICKRIVEAHGGEIACTAAPEGGAMFTCTFPKGGSKTTAATAGSTPTADAARAPPSPPEQRRKALARILVVDDNDASIALARIMMFEGARMRCDFASAKSGEEALAMLRGGEPPDLVLLDITMPGMDGFELMSAIRADPRLRDVPIVMCTTSSYHGDMERAKDLGAIGYINKPPNLEKLLPVLEKLPSLRLATEPQGHVLLRVA